MLPSRSNNLTGPAFARFVVRFRLLVLLAVALISGLAAIGVRRVAFDSDIEIWFLDEDPALVTYHRFLEEFDVDSVTVLALFADDVFTPEILRVLDRLTEATAEAPHVLRTRSLTNAKIVESKGAFHASIGPLIDELPTSQAQAAALRERALANPLIRDYVVSPDGRVAAVTIETDPDHKDFDEKAETVNALKAIARRHIPAGIEWHLAGGSVLDKAFFDYTVRDFSVLGPVASLVAFLIGLLIFRRVFLALLPLAVVLLANLWTFGLMGWLGLEINIVSTALFTVILAIGIANTVHVVAEYQQELAAGHERREALVRSVSALLVPCFFASITTVAGFISLMVSELQPIDEFGWLSAAGVAFAFALSLTFAPAVLTLIPGPSADSKRRSGTSWLDGALGWAATPSRWRSLFISATSAALFVLSLVSIRWLDVGANPMNYFRRDEPARVSTLRVDEGFGSSATYELRIETKVDGLKEPEVLDRLAKLQRRFESLPAVTRVFSVLDTLKEVRRVMTDGKPESARLPDTRPMAAQFYLMIEGDDDFRRNVKSDYALTRMTALVKLSESGKLTGRAAEIQEFLKRDFQDEQLHVETTGSIKLMSNMENYLLESQIRSLSFAFVVVTLMMLVLLRSARMMLLSMVPNIVPVLLGLCLMAVCSIALDPGTVMIASMVLGLVVDDTVHFLVRLKRNIATLELEAAIARSMRQTGRAIVFTSLILSAGLGTLVVGSFRPNAYFGLVSAFVILVALAADLLVLPALLVLLRPKLASASAVSLGHAGP